MTVCIARCCVLYFKVCKGVRVFVDFVEGGVGVDVNTICVGSVNNLSRQVGEDN